MVGASGGAAQHEIEVEDCVVAALRFSSGARGTIVATTAAAPGFPPPRRGLWQSGRSADRGRRAGPLGGPSGGPRRERAPDPPQAPAAVATGSGASPTGIGTLGHTLIVQDFVAAIREGRDPLVNGVEGRRSLALVLAIYEAAGLGGENRGRAGDRDRPMAG